MCRIFGFRSVLFSQVHSSLISADNALMSQSEFHPDGWGVAYYIGGTPHIVKSLKTAMSDQLFKKVSGVVTSQSVVAHLRKATKGSVNILNTHPFQYGKWVFAHNGNIRDLANHKEELLNLIDHNVKKYILGETDSEIIFAILLSEIKKDNQLHSHKIDVKKLNTALKNSLIKVCNIIGELKNEEKGFPTQNYLTMVLTNGEVMVGVQGGQPLYYSTHKNRCPERDTCHSFNDSCENPVTFGNVNHLIFSSEPLQGENIWNKMSPGQIVTIGADFEITIDQINLPFIQES